MPNSGFDSTLKKYSAKWTRADLPIIVHLMADRPEETARMLRRLENMENIYDQLMRFDHPSAIVPIRRKQDVARTLIEKTRGEIAVATRGKVLEDKISGLEGKL